MGGVDQRLFGPSATAPPEKKSKKNKPHRDSGGVQQSHPENQVTDIAKSNNMSPGALSKKWELIPHKVHLLGNNNNSDFP